MNWSSSGDLGDIVVALCVAKHAAAKSTLLLRDDGRTKGICRREHIIAPLVKSQTYIEDCRAFKAGDHVDWPSEGFRAGYHSRVGTLQSAHARHALATKVIETLPDQTQPWLTVPEGPMTKKAEGRVVINRSPRYNNGFFPWTEIVEHYGDLLLFVGLPEEHRAFCDAHGTVPYLSTRDMLEVGQAIAGSSLFIGNQSSAMTIAEGLKHPRIQEVSLHVPDCVYPKAHNAQYVATKYAELPAIGDRPAATIGHPSHRIPIPSLSMREVPRGGWTVKLGPYNESAATADLTAKQLARRAKIGYDEALRLVYDQTLKRDFAYFKRHVNTAIFNTAATAIEAAGYPDHPAVLTARGQVEFVY